MGLDIWFDKKNPNYDEDKTIDLQRQIDEIEELLYSKEKEPQNEEKAALYEKAKELSDELFDVSYTTDDDIAYFRGDWFILSFFNYTDSDNCTYRDITKEEIRTIVQDLRAVVALNKSDFAIGDDYIDACNRLIGGFDDIEWSKGITILDDDFKEYVGGILNKFERILHTFDWEHDTLVMYAWW